MTANGVLRRARRQLSDSVSPYRWDSGTLLDYLNDGILEIVRRHPEAMYLTSVSVDEPSDLESDEMAEDLPLRNEYAASLMHYVVWRAIGEDSEDAANRALSQEHYNAFIAEMS